jgi:pyruvate dehydrogenase phosphatase
MQVSRSMGDMYLKHPQYNTDRIKPKFRTSEPFSRPILSANPYIVSRDLQPSDSFVIFASDGLWEHLSNQEAVEIVNNHQRAVRFYIFYFTLNASDFMVSPVMNFIINSAK